MKVAEVTYTGRTRNKRHRAPNGAYRFGPNPVVIEDVEDARYFDRKANFEVDFTSRGRLLDAIRSDADDAFEAIEELEYNAKRSLASELDLETDSQEESVLEEAIKDKADDLKRHMESQ